MYIYIYIAYKIDFWSDIQGRDFALENSLFGAVKLTENANPDKYKYSGYCIGFNAHRFLL